MTNLADAKAVFWDVDTQVDFLHSSGKLCLPGGEAIIPNLQILTSLAREQSIPLVASVCAHEENDEEFQMFNPHCLIGTTGQKKIPETQLDDHFLIPNHPIDLPPVLSRSAQIVIEKQAFDVFTNHNATALLSRFKNNPVFFIYGVVTEVCVAAAARGLLAKGHQVAIVRDAVHHINQEAAQKSLQDLHAQGAKFILTTKVPNALAALNSRKPS